MKILRSFSNENLVALEEIYEPTEQNSPKIARNIHKKLVNDTGGISNQYGKDEV